MHIIPYNKEAMCKLTFMPSQDGYALSGGGFPITQDSCTHSGGGVLIMNDQQRPEAV